MTDKEFFAQIQADWFAEFVDTDLSENSGDTIAQIEIFEFDDVPF